MKEEYDSRNLRNFLFNLLNRVIKVFRRLVPVQVYYIRINTVGFKKWLLRFFNVSFKGVDYYDRGVRIFGWTFIWTN